MLLLDGISKSFDAFGKRITALFPVNLTLGSGTRALLFGPNGSGKTTLLNCIAGLLLPDTGRIAIGQTDSRSGPAFRRMIGYAGSRTDSFYPRLTIRQNLEFFSLPFTGENQDSSTCIDAGIKLLGLEDFASLPFQQASNGIKKRAVIARSIIHRPALLLADEWADALDERIIRKFTSYISSSTGKSISIFASQRITGHEDWFNSFLVLDGGRLLFAGNREELKIKAQSHSVQQALLNITGMDS